MLLTNVRKKILTHDSIKNIFKDEDGAIDLASIMVGIIVIGLIGGVIAATVFAVIPWSQDNAAKQQLDSIHTSENAYFGMNSDPSTTLLTGQTRNTFTDSAGLEKSNLLTDGPDFCVITLNGGKDYQAYSKSGSGTVFTASNSNKKATAVTSPIIDGCSGLNPDNLTPAPTGPIATPGYKILGFYDFETDTPNSTPKEWFGNTGYGWTYAGATTGYDGTKGMWANQYDPNNEIAAFKNGKYIMQAGKTYKITAWTKFEANGPVTMYFSYAASQGTAVLIGNKASDLDWNKRTFTYTAQSNSNMMITSYVPHGNKIKMFMDDVLIEEKLP